MNKEILDKESETKREKKLTRVLCISILIALVGGIFFTLFMPDEPDFFIMGILLYVLIFQLFIFIWVFRLQYHLVPTLLKDDESMELDEVP